MTLGVLWKLSLCAFWVDSVLYWRQKQHALVWKLDTQMEESIDETDGNDGGHQAAGTSP